MHHLYLSEAQAKLLVSVLVDYIESLDDAILHDTEAEAEWLVRRWKDQAQTLTDILRALPETTPDD